MAPGSEGNGFSGNRLNPSFAAIFRALGYDCAAEKIGRSRVSVIGAWGQAKDGAQYFKEIGMVGLPDGANNGARMGLDEPDDLSDFYARGLDALCKQDHSAITKLAEGDSDGIRQFLVNSVAGKFSGSPKPGEVRGKNVRGVWSGPKY
jgi:hypothetical protein